MSEPKILSETLSCYARMVLENIQREYPNKPGNIIVNASQVQNPKTIHPAFYGCFDWHSSVHSHWFLVRVLQTITNLPETAKIRETLNYHLSAENLMSEADYFRRGENSTFERPYGWSWVLKLAQEAGTWDDSDSKNWFANLQPLVKIIVKLYGDYLRDLDYPIRAGIHNNTAFGIAFALDFARFSGDEAFENLLIERSLAYFYDDIEYPAAWEPDGEDFLSGALTEADLMGRVLERAKFASWFGRFLPGIEKNEPAQLLTPVNVTNLSDPRIVHLIGLNLSRAWCLLGIAEKLLIEKSVSTILRNSAKLHAESALSSVRSGDYGGDHWLASFALNLTSHPLYKSSEEHRIVKNSAPKVGREDENIFENELVA